MAAVTAVVMGAPEGGETEVAGEGLQEVVTPEVVVAQAEGVPPGEATLVEEEGAKTWGLDRHRGPR